MIKPIKAVRDNFMNLVSNLNTDRDKQSHGEHTLTQFTDAQWSAVYRTSWMGRKVIDIPAQDATRKWREWQAEADQIEKLEAEEKRVKIRQKVKLAIQQARLFGGAGIYFSIKNDDPALPIEPKTVKAGALDFITVLSKNVLVPGDVDMDPLSEYYGKPMWYEVSSQTEGVVRIHPSRIAVFVGHEILDPEEASVVRSGWGDSVLMAAYEAVRNADSTASNIASLVYESKIDVLQIPDLGDIMANPRTRDLLVERVELSGQLKGNNGMLIIDGDEDYSQKQFTFGGLPEISYQTLQSVAGAADIPITRFLGQAPGGIIGSGEADLKNYYDAVNSMQTLTISPALVILDEVLIRSALGDWPPDVFYEWSSLWQMSDEQKSKISKETAETISILNDTQLFPEEELAVASVNLLVEHSIMPSLELGEFEEGEEEDDSDVV